MSKSKTRALEIGINIGIIIFIVGIISRYTLIGSGRVLQLVGLTIALICSFSNLKSVTKGKAKATIQFGALMLVALFVLFRMIFGFAFQWVLFIVILFLLISYGKYLFSSKK
ncbi:MAG: hypothetical protein MK066_09480 [Crocinitomicaceae bacterium]|nr:hypothetical protein [Crocinitomicaceae bacterium]